ncbi:MAG: hypothetical protein OHK0029_39310 [Armatimonadaceae bacterium]
MPIRASDRRRLRQIYAFACGYCGISESETGSELTVDHFVPLAHGGTDDIANLVYACHACNEFKADHFNQSETRRILHPLNENLDEHLVENEDGSLSGRTPVGEFHIALLHLNRPPLIRDRLGRRILQAIVTTNAQLAVEVNDLKNLLHEILIRIDRNTPLE